MSLWRPSSALMVTVLIGAAISFSHGALWLPWRHLDSHGADFAHYYEAASALRAGVSPYRVHAFDYPPLPAFLLAPLTVVSYEGARRVWLVIGQLSLLAAAWFGWRALGGGRAALLAVALAWGAAGTFAENLVLGQLHPLLLLLLALAFSSMTRRPLLAGTLVGAASALKLWPAVLLPALAATRWRAALAGIVVALLLVVLPLVGLRAGWPPPYLPTSADYWMGTPAPLNGSLPAISLRLLERPAVGAPLPASWRFGDHPAGLDLAAGHRAVSVVTSLLTLLVGGAAIAWAQWGGGWARGRPSPGPGSRSGPPSPPPSRALLLLAATLSLTLLASPISWYHYQLFQVLPAALLAYRWLCRGAVGSVVALTVVLAALTRLPAWSLGIYVARFGWEATRPPVLWLATSIGPALGVVFFALVVVELRRTAAAETILARATPQAA